MEIRFSKVAIAQLKELRMSGKKSTKIRLKSILQSIRLDPYSGIGKPELLKYDLKDRWSRRLSKEDRIVYKVNEDNVLIYSILGHYEY